MSDSSSDSDSDVGSGIDSEQEKVVDVPDSAGNAWQGTIALVLAVLIFSSNGVAYKFLFTDDPELFNACNVLCGANLFGLVTLPFVFRKDLTLANFKAITWTQWAALVFGTICYSAVGPLLFLLALESITIASASILGRLESLEFLILAVIFLGEKVDSWSLFNAALTLVGILVALLSPPLFGSTLELNTGSVLMICSGFFYAGSLFVTKKWLSTIPVGVLAMLRVGMGTVIYHGVVLLQGAETGDLKMYSLTFWKKMWWYALIYVTVAQTVWLMALSKANSTTISVGTTTQFVLSLIWAMLLLNSFPTNPQWLGSAFIVASIVSSILRSIKMAPARGPDAISGADEDEDETEAEM